MASINSLILGKGYPSSIITAFRPIGAEHTLIDLSFFSTTEMLAEYGLVLGRIIPLLSRSWIFCFIFLCMAGSNDFGLAVIGNRCIRLILCLRTFVRLRSSLCWATTSL